MSCKSAASREAQKFAAQTSINSLEKVLSASHWTEIAFWTLLLGGCVYLSVRDCLVHINAYANEATVSVVELRANDTVEFPGSTLCINLDIGSFRATNVSRLTDAQSLVRFGNCIRSEPCARSSRFFADFYDELGATLKVISSYVAAENGKKAQLEATNRVAFEVPMAFYRFLLGTNLSIGALRKRVTYALCDRMAFDLQLWHKLHKNTSVRFCDVVGAPTWLGIPPDTHDEAEVLCYNIGAFTRFESKQDQLVVSYIAERIYADGVGDNYSVLSYLNLEQTLATTDLTSNFVEIKHVACTDIEVAVSVRVRSLSKRRRACAEELTLADCIGACRVASMLDVCNCSAVSYPAAGDAPSCFETMAPRDAERCGRIAKNTEEARACTTACRRDGMNCVRTILDFRLDSCAASAYRNGSTTFWLKMKQMDYVSCEESLSMDAAALASNLGGVLGLWLEAGFIGVVHVFVFAFGRLIAAGRSASGLKCPRDVDDSGEEVAALRAKVEALAAQVSQVLPAESQPDLRNRRGNSLSLKSSERTRQISTFLLP